MPKKPPDIGATIVISKPDLDTVLKTLSSQDYQLEGPQVKDFTVTLGPIEKLADLPKGYISQEEPWKIYPLLKRERELF